MLLPKYVFGKSFFRAIAFRAMELDLPSLFDDQVTHSDLPGCLPAHKYKRESSTPALTRFHRFHP
jgi:hypothetical protein